MTRTIRFAPRGRMSTFRAKFGSQLVCSTAFAALMILLLAWSPTAMAQDGATLTPSSPVLQLGCGEPFPMTWTYVPDSGATPAMRGYSIRIQVPEGLTFLAGDVTVYSPLGGVNDTHFILENGEGDVTIDFTFLDPGEGLTATADLFSIVMTGNMTLAEDIGTTSATIRDLSNQPITTDASGVFALAVDCSGPDIPALDLEPAFTAGVTNTVGWSDESASGALTYNVQAATDGGFLTIVDESGWIGGLSHEFTGLVEGTTYYYRVAARNFIDLSLGYSGFEFSTQDDTAPVTSAGPLGAAVLTTTFDVPVQFTDALSGPGTVELFYNFGGGAWTSYGSFPGDGPVAFIAPSGDGLYGFYTQGTDGVGNTETAVPGAQASTTLDTTGPFATFTANGGVGATNNINVTLDIDGYRVNKMRFSNDGTTWPEDWVSLSTSHPWTIDAIPGTRTIYGEFRLGNGPIWATTTGIDYDTTPTAAVTAPTAGPGDQQIHVSWTNPADADFDKVEIWRGLLHDGGGASDYPEYIGSTVPTPPASRAAALADPDWVLAGTSDPGATEFTDSVSPRGIYYYAAFPFDIAGNVGPPAASTPRATNYVLGDIGLPNDGRVLVFDLTVLAATYGRIIIEPGFNSEADIGPTDDASGTGVPLPDGGIDFEDLQIASQNFDAGSKGAPAASGTHAGPALLAWCETTAGTWTLELKSPCPSLKGLRLTADLPNGVIATVRPGEALVTQSSPVFLQNIPSRGLDAGMSILGQGRGLVGAGSLMTVVFSGGIEPFSPGSGSIGIELRDTANHDLAFELEGTKAGLTPLPFSLGQAFPNPFNPRTTIKFSLPAEAAVRLEIYGLDGRRVAILVDDILGPGIHEAVWPGLDHSGRPAASGVYFTKLTSGSLSQVQKMTLMK